MLHIISMHRLSDPRQTAINTLSKVIIYLVASRFEDNTLAVRAKQHNHSFIAVATYKYTSSVFIDSSVVLGLFLIYLLKKEQQCIEHEQR
jgi:hypothetical protein